MKVEVLQKKIQILLQKIITYNLKFCSQKITNMFPPEKNEKSSLAKYGRQINVTKHKNWSLRTDIEHIDVPVVSRILVF